MKKYIFSLVLVFSIFPAVSFAEEPIQTVVDYVGELVDQNAAPVSGVLPMEFRVFPSAKSRKPIATEKHFIAVVDGAYAVSLGEQETINTKNTELYVAVYLDGRELTRQKVSTKQQIVVQNPKTMTTDTVGSQKKDAFKLECPPGYVVTGIEGSLKGGIQSLRAICSKTI